MYTGYAFLLDRQNRIRWQGCGEATQEEILTMITCAERLVKEK